MCVCVCVCVCVQVENTIRWRYSTDESGNEVRESNARIVRWTDGSMSLYLGGEIFDIYKQSLQGEYSHLFVRQGRSVGIGSLLHCLYHSTCTAFNIKFFRELII